MKQKDNETITQYVTRLREAAKRCTFHDSKREIKDQVVFNCISDKLRRECLRKDYDLDKLLEVATAYERAESQAVEIENEGRKVRLDVHKVAKPGKYSNKSRVIEKAKVLKCFSCDEVWPHKGGKKACPAYDHTCKICHQSNHFEKICKNKNKVMFRQLEKNESSEESDDNYVYSIKSFQSVHENKTFTDKEILINSVTTSTSVNLKVHGVYMKFQIDSGAAVNIISEKDFGKLKNVYLKKTKIKLYPYGMEKPLTLLAGYFEAEIESKNKLDYVKFFVVKSGKNVDNLLGVSTASALGVLKVVNSVSNNVKETALKDESGVNINFSSKVVNDVIDVKKTDVTDESVSNILDQYQTCFSWHR